ncbi:hypothetical protein QBC33DRAFT_597351 [Phialemonium atrogriseum]|uniref:Uncharacterized protein n=1 Tax=Phialemonium atrogriseum TaxID=1093897 RepID=A0AAJ0C8C7_9PEZI|nr:uncharacterized protein QBC33DRAFT_597351 [Phialemonium atrogriseum]KAK1770853.1 hypothetical protein QBC33DRAFT_597351 [Phialemonium atrogriseum]
MNVKSLLTLPSESVDSTGQAGGKTGGQTTHSSTPEATRPSMVVDTGSRPPSPSRRTGGSGTPNQNRIPWDGGGYSLPFPRVNTSIHTTAAPEPGLYSESRMVDLPPGSPKSPKHKLSDSRSSSSSSRPDICSTPHSRISSTSTLNEFHATAKPAPEQQPVDDRMATDHEVRRPIADEVVGHTQLGATTTQTSSSIYATIHPFALGGPSRGPGSPSDALLIMRGGISNPPSPMEPPPDANLLSAPSPSSPGGTHKRSISAPGASTGFGGQGEGPPPPLPPPQQPEPSSSPDQGVYGWSTETKPDLEADLRCMFTDNCPNDQGQLRKAISHLFGRNKSCTRSIPPQVWVHFCRKHYQRSRYRNGCGYSKMQCELVGVQLDRVEYWSDNNRRNNQPGVVRGWELAIRKREKERIDKDPSGSKKRPRSDDSEEMGEEPGPTNGCVGNPEVGNNPPVATDPAVVRGTAVPEWLLDNCRKGYTTKQIKDIVKRIGEALKSGALTQVPDIELLADITGPETNTPKPCAKRRATHERSQSVGSSTRAEGHSTKRRVSHPTIVESPRSNVPPPQTRDRWPDAVYHQQQPYIPVRPSIPDLPYLGSQNQGPNMQLPMNELPYRPAPYMRGNEPSPAQVLHHPPHGTMRDGPLPAPAPRRTGFQSVAHLLEPRSGQPDPTVVTRDSAPYSNPLSRPSHNRSYSDAFPRYGNPPEAWHSPAVPYTPVPGLYNPPPAHEYTDRYENGYTSAERQPSNYQEVPPPQSHHFQPSHPLLPRVLLRCGRSPTAGPGHSRHQSTPVVPFDPRPPTPMDESGPGPGPGPGPSHTRRQSHAFGAVARVIEEDQHLGEGHMPYHEGGASFFAHRPPWAPRR